MNVSYKWLKELIDFDFSPEELAERLTFAGLEVERMTPVGDDWCIELELTSNRPDCLSIIGVAREIGVMCAGELRIPDFSVKTSGDDTASFTSVEILDPDLCPRYTAQIIRDVKIKESPDWLKEKLEAIGVRPVNNVVDVTNYVTMEFGQPLHAFDYDKLSENRIVVRRAKPGESITAINGKSYHLTEDMLAICDAREPVAIAGVMGGLFSEVTERTTDILLESAYFDPVSVRRTSRQLMLESAASYRFERGVDPEFVLPASLRAARLILELAEGTLAPAPVDAGSQQTASGTATVRFARIPRIIGYEVNPERVAEILSSLGLRTTEKNTESLTVDIPPRRRDISREVDLIEEILRHEGIDKVPFTGIAVSEVRPEPKQKFLLKTREQMRGFGFYELLTDSFVTDDEMGSLCFFAADEPVRVRNPVTAEKPTLRRSLLPNMLGAYRSCLSTGENPAGMFEASVVYLPGTGKLPNEKHVLCFVTPGNYLTAKGILEALCESVRASEVSYAGFTHAAFASDRASTANISGTPLAFLGELSSAAARHFDIESSCAVCEIDLDLLYSSLKGEASFTPIPRYPKVLRDMAIVIGEDILWQDIRAEILGLPIPLLAKIEMFDIYHGRQLPAGKKSVAFSLEFQSAERTLTGEEVDKLVSGIASHLEKRFDATLRK